MGLLAVLSRTNHYDPRRGIIHPDGVTRQGFSVTDEGKPVTPLARRLSELRKSKGLTQEGLAKALGTRQSTVQGWEQGRGPTLDGLVTLADYYEVDLRWLATGEGTKKPRPQGEAELVLEYIRAVIAGELPLPTPADPSRAEGAEEDRSFADAARLAAPAPPSPQEGKKGTG